MARSPSPGIYSPAQSRPPELARNLLEPGSPEWLLDRQDRWLRAKVVLEPKKWRVGVSIDISAGKMTPFGWGWTSEMRQEFGRFQGGLKQAGNGARRGAPLKYDEAYDRVLNDALRALREKYPRWGSPALTARLVADGHDVKRWKIERLLAAQRREETGS